MLVKTEPVATTHHGQALSFSFSAVARCPIREKGSRHASCEERKACMDMKETKDTHAPVSLTTRLCCCFAGQMKSEQRGGRVGEGRGAAAASFACRAVVRRQGEAERANGQQSTQNSHNSFQCHTSVWHYCWSSLETCCLEGTMSTSSLSCKQSTSTRPSSSVPAPDGLVPFQP